MKKLIAVAVLVGFTACKTVYPDPKPPQPCDMNFETKTYNDPTAGCDMVPDAGQ